MGCHHPIRAWRTSSGEVRLNRETPNAAPLALPCGGCLGCRTAKAKEWALRCHLELGDHQSAAVATLTYDEEHCPPTLRLRDLQLYHKRLRQQLNRLKTAEPIRLRHFASGEYGEENGRPHFHSILFGPDAATHQEQIQSAWTEAGRKRKRPALGHVHIDTVTPAVINYVAGYVAKKLDYRRDGPKYVEAIDYDTGELGYVRWQQPFITMSRNPGIGGKARTEYTNSWRAYAIMNGNQMPVPKYLHDAWKAQATPQQLEELEYERFQNRIRKTPITPEQLHAAEEIAKAKHKLQAARRQL